MESKVLVFNSSYEGHHYYYMNLLLKSKNKNLTYYIHPELLKRIDIPNEQENNIYTINKNDLNLGSIPTHNVKVGILKRLLLNYRLWSGIKKICKENRIRDILFIELDSFVIFFTTLFFSKYRIKGIYYQPYNFRNKKNLKEFIKKIIFNFLINKNFNNGIFILDEYFITKENYQLNKKITYLPDPIPKLNSLIEKEIEKIFINPKFTFLFLGYIDKRKGIIQVLDSLTDLPDELVNIRLIVSGKIDPGIIDLVKQKIETISKRIEIIVLNRFLSESEINTLLINSDALLAPYLNHVGSSGIINIALGYNKPIITQNTNLIGDLISEYKFGIGINTSKNNEILQAMILIKNKMIDIDNFKSNRYIKTHSEREFVEVLTKVK